MEVAKLKYGPYSPSRLDTGICGYAFHKQYVDPERKNRPRVENLPQARGSAVHEVFELITQTMIKDPNHIFDEKAVRNWVVEAVKRHPVAYEEVGPILEMSKLYINRPPATLVSDAEVELKVATKAVKENGQIKFVACDYDDPDAFGRGKADVLMISDDTTEALIYDHKTQPNVEEADTFQLGFYAWVILKTYPFLERISTVLHFARYGMYSQPVVWTREQLEEIEDEIITRVSIIEDRQDWGPVPHSKCQYCPLLSECPAMEDFLNVDPSTGQVTVKPENYKILGQTGKAVQLAGVLNVMEEAVKTIKGELRQYVKQSGSPVAIPGKIFGYQAKEEIHWDKLNKSGDLRNKAYEIFEKNEIDPRDHMGFSQTFTKDVWLHSNEELVKELSALFPRRVKSEFKGYKG